MSQARTRRSSKRQKGQFLTPVALATRVVEDLVFRTDDRVLEPGFGEGAFLIPLISRFLHLHIGTLAERLDRVLTHNIWGVEIDQNLYEKALTNIEEVFGYLPKHHNLYIGDFLADDSHHLDQSQFHMVSAGNLPSSGFTHVIGNPPFGGTIAVDLQDSLDKTLGRRHGMKIKKETYSWFIVRSMDLLAPGGHLRFICSDTFLTISTMRGLRHALSLEGAPTVSRLDSFSPETSYPMVVLDWIKGGTSNYIVVDEQSIAMEDVENTINLSWGITAELADYFTGSFIGNVLIATSGMTTGNNKLFVRSVRDGYITEPYRFSYIDAPITLEGELQKARLGRLSAKRRREIHALESVGATQRELVVTTRREPIMVGSPYSDYLPYNKAARGLVYTAPTHYIYWKDNGDAVLTYKRTGNWYLRGVGGAKYFGREGITWSLVSQSLDVRFLPDGYILDSGAPCAFPRPGVAKEELLFVMGWLLTSTCTRILKQVINHTMNIQGKDIERLPYPTWVKANAKKEAIKLISSMVSEARRSRIFTRQDAEFDSLEAIYQIG